MSQKLIRYGYRTRHGPTIRELIWQQLDDAMDHLMSVGKPEASGEEISPIELEEWQEYGKLQGIAEATAYILALFEGPDYPDIDTVRGAAVLRYKERQHLKELQTLEEVVEDVEAINPDPGDDGGADDAAREYDGDARAGQASEGTN